MTSLFSGLVFSPLFEWLEGLKWWPFPVYGESERLAEYVACHADFVVLISHPVVACALFLTSPFVAVVY